MKNIIAFICLLALFTGITYGQKSPTIADAKAEVKANLGSETGKEFDEKVGRFFGENYGSMMGECVKASDHDMRSFTLYVQLGSDGAVERVLQDPETKVSSCTTTKVLKDKFPAPPRSDYWVDIQMTLK